MEFGQLSDSHPEYRGIRISEASAVGVAHAIERSCIPELSFAGVPRFSVTRGYYYAYPSAIIMTSC